MYSALLLGHRERFVVGIHIIKFLTARALISDILTLCDGIFEKVMGIKVFILVYFTSVTFLCFKHTIFAKRTYHC